MQREYAITLCGTVILFLATLTQAQQMATVAPQAESLATVPSGRVITVTPQPGFQNEPSVAVNTRDPKQVIAAYQTGPHVAFSRDGGLTWEIAAGTAQTRYRVSGDVSVTYDKQGNAFLCYISFDKLGTENYWAHGATRNGIYVRRSLDGGTSWEKQDHAVIAQPTKPGIPFEDKPYIVADDSDSRYSGNLYVGWTEFRINESVILFARSSDGGQTWSAPIEISTHHGLPRDDNGAVEGFTGAVASDGTLYAVWADGDSIVLASSHDGGKTFGHSRAIIQTAPLYFALAGLERANGFPQIAIDRHQGRKGQLYVTWSDYRDGDVGVFCATSNNGGRSWSKPVRVNSNPVHDGTDQFFQWLAVDPSSGAANVIFYDRRLDPRNERTTVTLARSTDGGRSFTNYAWNKEAFVPRNDQFLGDYIGIAALNGRVYGAWAEIEAPARKSPPPAETERRPARTIVRIGIADFGPKTSSEDSQ